MKKQFYKAMENILTRSNRSHSDTVREFFNCVSYTMIMNSLYQLEKENSFTQVKQHIGFQLFSMNCM
jgi:hypothetical protein